MQRTNHKHVSQLIDLCVFAKKCEFKKRHIIGKRSGNPLDVYECTWNSTCNQKFTVNLREAREILSKEIC